MGKNYGDESIRSQSAVETCRNNLPTFFGSTDVQGAFHSLKEILSNSVDEEKVKDIKNRGKIEVTVHKDNSITIKDEGRGLPLDWNKKENKWNWILNLQTLHAGGKFSDMRDNFKNSTGMNGLGLAVTAMSSSWIKIESRYGGNIYNVELKKGVPTESNEDKVLKKTKDPKGSKQQTGTTISWKCDTDEVYLDDNFDLETLKNWCKTQAILTDGTTVVLKDERAGFSESYKYNDGIKTFAEESIGKDTPITEFTAKGNGKDAAKFKSYDVECRVLFAFTDAKPDSYYYHNSLPLTLGGSPLKAEQTAFLDFFQKQTKNKKLEFSDIQENLFYISNTLTQISPTFRNQTKDAIDMPFIEQFLMANITKQLNDWMKKNRDEYEKVCKQVVINQEARTATASARQLTKEKLSAKAGLSNKIDKLTECRSKDNDHNEVFIVEGDSAAGTIRNARNPEYQAVYALRGKPNNVHKIGLSKLLENEGVLNMFKVFGTGITVPDKKSNKVGEFNIDARRFSKYIIASDQDIDGLHIACLIITIVFDYMPELINKGYLYRLETPLFIIKTPDGDKYCYSDAERDKILKQYGNKVKKINRFKGLGEFNKDQFAVLLKPENRKLTRYTVKDVKEAQRVIDLWMGNDPDIRKKYIAEHSKEYKDVEMGSEG